MSLNCMDINKERISLHLKEAVGKQQRIACILVMHEQTVGLATCKPMSKIEVPKI